MHVLNWSLCLFPCTGYRKRRRQIKARGENIRRRSPTPNLRIPQTPPSGSANNNTVPLNSSAAINNHQIHRLDPSWEIREERGRSPARANSNNSNNLKRARSKSPSRSGRSGRSKSGTPKRNGINPMNALTGMRRSPRSNGRAAELANMQQDDRNQNLQNIEMAIMNHQKQIQRNRLSGNIDRNYRGRSRSSPRTLKNVSGMSGSNRDRKSARSPRKSPVKSNKIPVNVHPRKSPKTYGTSTETETLFFSGESNLNENEMSPDPSDTPNTLSRTLPDGHIADIETQVLKYIQKYNPSNFEMPNYRRNKYKIDGIYNSGNRAIGTNTGYVEYVCLCLLYMRTHRDGVYLLQLF